MNDFNFNPFNDNILATACQDGSLVLWSLPDGELTQNLTNPFKTIRASEKRYFDCSIWLNGDDDDILSSFGV